MSEFSDVHFASEQVRIGTFYCPVSHPVFPYAGEMEGYTVVFPRTSVQIAHEGHAPVIADPNVVMFYNKGQPYQRGKVSEQGDLCDWFDFDFTAVIDVIREYDPAVEERWLTPFQFTHTPSVSAIYLQQRRLIHYLHQTTCPDPLLVEEVTFAILQQVLANAYQKSGFFPQKNHPSAHYDVVHEVKALLAMRFKDAITLTEIATAVYTSPYHLSRIFHQYTGFTIHNYLNQLRLRTALGYLAQSDMHLTDLGLELGYSSHSHFTQAFRRTFGTAPSTFRATASSQRIQEMRKILIA